MWKASPCQPSQWALARWSCSAAAVGRARAGVQKLDSDDAFEPSVVGTIDRTHSTRAERRLESVVAEHVAGHRVAWFGSDGRARIDASQRAIDEPPSH